jgi:hypothetical protein
MRRLFIAAFAILLATPVLAGTYRIPEDNPIATVVVPDKGWSADKIARGIEVSDDDDEVYLSVEAIDGHDATSTAASALVFLERQGVKVDATTKVEKEGKVGEFAAYDIGWKGTDKDGDVLIHLLIVTVTPARGVLFTYYASPEGDKEHEAALTAILKSLRKAG